MADEESADRPVAAVVVAVAANAEVAVVVHRERDGQKTGGPDATINGSAQKDRGFGTCLYYMLCTGNVQRAMDSVKKMLPFAHTRVFGV